MHGERFPARVVARAVRLTAVAVAAALASACPGSSSSTPSPSPSPTPSGPTVTAVAPTSGPAAGGTLITVSGSNFAGGAAVTVGGTPATDVRVSGTVSLTAVTPAHAPGTASITVTVGGLSATLASAFTFVAPPAPTVTAIAPTSGSAAGGTRVTITGTNFAAGATVTIGGVAATAVEFVSATTLRAVTGPRAAGAGDVVVTIGTQSGTLPAGYAYVTPVPNPLPVITSLTVQGPRASQPPGFADLGEEVVVTATIVDHETPIDRLLIEWTADAGTFSGSGPSVRWRAPTGIVAPAQIRITVRVTEPLESSAAGVPTITQSVTATTTVRVHNSVKEISDLSVQFLVDFSDSNLSPAFVVRNFWDGCPGKADELIDIENNRKAYIITAYRIDQPTSATVTFQGTCAFKAPVKGDGCVQTPALWNSIFKATGKSETAQGIAQTSAVYRESRWWLCDSLFIGTVSNPTAAVPFIR